MTVLSFLTCARDARHMLCYLSHLPESEILVNLEETPVTSGNANGFFHVYFERLGPSRGMCFTYKVLIPELNFVHGSTSSLPEGDGLLHVSDCFLS